MKKRIILSVLSLALVLSACTPAKKVDTVEETKAEISKEEKKVKEEALFINGKKENVKVLLSDKGGFVEFKDKVYPINFKQYEDLKKENNWLFTFDNKVIEKFKEDDIKSYDNYGSFYQVLLKNGEQVQVFDKPTTKFAAANDYSKLNNGKNIKGIYKHGDHWHVLYDDGKEVITYKDPTKINANELEKSNVKVLENSNSLDKDKIVKVLKHGDHYHIYLADGTEYISYEKPNNLPAGVTIGEYTGPSHSKHDSAGHLATNDKKNNENSNNKINNNQNTSSSHNEQKQNNKQNHEENKPSQNDKPKIKRIRVVSFDFLKRLKISAVKVHGDHYHVYDDKGNEYITYDSNVRKLVDKVTDYEGNHGDSSNPKKHNQNNKPNKPSPNKKPDTNKKLSENEIIDIKKKDGKWIISLKNGKKITSSKLIFDNGNIILKDSKEVQKENNKIDESKPNKPENKPEENKPNKPAKKEYYDPFTKEKVVKVLKHGDHYHIYYENGEESVMEGDPQEIWPGIEIGEYEGSHGDHEKPNKKPEEKPNKPKKENEETKPDKPQDEPKTINYKDIKAELVIKDYEKTLSYGGMIYTTGFDEEKNEFIVPHHDHFHNISISRIIDLANNGAFGKYKAEDVIATLKYFVENPAERPKKAGWGDSADGNSAEENEEHDEMKLNYIAKKYGLDRYDMNQFFRIGNTVTIYIDDKSYTIELSDLEIVDGKVKEVVPLPDVKKKEGN